LKFELVSDGWAFAASPLSVFLCVNGSDRPVESFGDGSILFCSHTKKRIACNVIDVTINGKKQPCEEGLTIVELLDLLGMNSRAIAVEINQEIQPRDTHSHVKVKDGDVLEIVTLVGGG
jgi:sulfur carrier protein